MNLEREISNTFNIAPRPTEFCVTNQLHAGLLASFPSKINTFRKRVKNVVTSKGIKEGFECK
jgi:hypothetical protein